MKSCDKFGNMNDDYIDQQTFFVLKSSSYLWLLHGRAANFLNTPRTTKKHEDRWDTQRKGPDSQVKDDMKMERKIEQSSHETGE